MVGASPKPSKASYFVATYLLSSSHYDVWFVNPFAKEILGRPVYPSLADLPGPPDIVDVFRRPEDLVQVAREAAQARAKVFWTQLGLSSLEAARQAERAGLEVVMDRCLKIEHARFHGGLHLAGFDTGVISSHRAVTAPTRKLTPAVAPTSEASRDVAPSASSLARAHVLAGQNDQSTLGDDWG
jgi:predicted CoA-binding protein